MKSIGERRDTYLIGVTEFAIFTRCDDRADKIVTANAKLTVKFIIVGYIDRKAQWMSSLR